MHSTGVSSFIALYLFFLCGILFICLRAFFLLLLILVKCRQTLRKKRSMSFHLKFVVLGQASSKQASIIRLSNPYSGLIFNL